ncbi:MAG: hypothetical protein MZW92_24920 [Comamonadaceae bacterium]|nr:hypothetical protein [Comamonadaceae bacterium]
MAPIFREWMEPFRSLGHDDAHHPQHRRHRPPGLRRGGPARASSSSRTRWSTTR